MKNEFIHLAKRQSEITAGRVLLCAAESAFGDPDKTTPVDSAYNRDLVTGILAAATAGGYGESQILEAALIQGQYSDRVLSMAEEACGAAGSAALRNVLDQALKNRSSNETQIFPEMFASDGNSTVISPAGMLVLAAHTYYRLKHENSQDRIENAKHVMQRILAEARAAGYARITQLSAALVRGECSSRVTNMANKACAKVPVETMRQILAQAKFC
ncbi:MAG: hypothetical protein JWL97_4322 [Gemmatimonadales bacterium]|nr:hypothetical protein [Gemmatimonadales bacterium]